MIKRDFRVYFTAMQPIYSILKSLMIRRKLFHGVKKRRRPSRLLLPPGTDLSWPMPVRHLRRDIFHSSGYLYSLHAHRPRLTTLPKSFLCDSQYCLTNLPSDLNMCSKTAM